MARLTSTAANGILLLLSAWMGAIAGCAAAYTPIQPMNIPYYREAPVEGDSNVTIDIKYDIFSHSGNKKYAKIESKSNIHLVGLRTNIQGDDTLYFLKTSFITTIPYPSNRSCLTKPFTTLLKRTTRKTTSTSTTSSSSTIVGP